MKKRKLLTLEDLTKFCLEQKMNKFSSKDTGYQLSVQVPATFEVDENDPRRDLMKLKIKVFHTGLNRNGSRISEESAKACFDSIKNRPILARIHKVESTGEYDFDAHNCRIVTNEDGEEEFEYIESQVGSFTEDEPFFEYDEENDKNFVCAYAVIPEHYTKAADIIRRKNGTKNSCELCIDEFSYSAADKCLDLEKFYLSGSTLLGTTDEGEAVGEGMLGSRADIIDFSTEQNSGLSQFNCDDKLVEVLEKLNTTLSNLHKENSEEGGVTQVNKLQELMQKYDVTEDQITFETEGLSDEELETKFEEAFGETTEGENDPENGEGSAEGEGSEDETGVKEENACGGGSGKKKKKKNSIEHSLEINGEEKKFAVSLDDKIYAIHCLVNETYADADNTYYGTVVFEDYVVMCDYCTGRYYKQSYTSENDNYSLTGDRVEVYAEFVTADEQKELNDMRSNYSAIEAELNSYKENELAAQKEAILADEAYAEFADTEEFKTLSKDASKYSVAELKDKCDLAFAKLVKAQGTFSAKPNTTTKPNTVVFAKHEEAPSKKPYGDLFD